MNSSKAHLIVFSEKFSDLLKENKVEIFLPEQFRKKLSTRISDYNFSWTYHDETNLSFTTDAFFESLEELCKQKGWHSKEDYPFWLNLNETKKSINQCILHEKGEYIFDLLEIIHDFLREETKISFSNQINILFKNHSSVWRISDGAIIKLDQNFVDSEMKIKVLERLIDGKYHGVLNEFRKAIEANMRQDYRHSIHMASCAVESMMKVILGKSTKSASKLCNDLGSSGFFDDLPSAKNIMINNVMMSVANLRNVHAGHGHGIEVEDTPKPYSDLAINLSASLISFLIDKKHSIEEPLSSASELSTIDDDIPF